MIVVGGGGVGMRGGSFVVVGVFAGFRSSARVLPCLASGKGTQVVVSPEELNV